MLAVDLRVRLSELTAERLFAGSYGMTANATYMADLDDEIAEVTALGRIPNRLGRHPPRDRRP
jgi:hypothetical protein